MTVEKMPAPTRSAYFDMHCHLDFAPNALQAAADLDAAGAGAFAVSVLPTTGKTDTAAQDGAASKVRWGVGLHPWWLADGRAGEEELTALLAAIPYTPYIGEVGLDFGKTHGDQREVQLAAFEAIARACAETGQRTLSIHAVRAAHEALDLLERTGANESCTCIFHWFSDSSEAFTRAQRLGCYFSVGELMLRSGRGREYARQVPVERLLFETDQPAQGLPYDVAAMQAQLAATCAQIAALRGVAAEDLAVQVACTSMRLLSCS